MARHRWFFGACAAALIGLAAPMVPALSDPDNLAPWCGAGETPTNTGCREEPSQSTIDDTAPGANPQVPVGLLPGREPVLGTNGAE